MKNYSFFKKEIFDKEPKLRTYQIKNLNDYFEKKKKYVLKIDPRIKGLKDYKKFKVFSVDGEKIRDNLDMDFVMGGNGSRYLYIPMNEIWIEGVYVKTPELKFILLHEYTELKLMEKGYNYCKAHDTASAKELRIRRK